MTLYKTENALILPQEEDAKFLVLFVLVFDISQLKVCGVDLTIIDTSYVR